TVVFYHPDDGLDYVAVSSAGILGGGITGMNAAGLTLVVHQHFVDDFDLDGVPVGYAGDRALRHAHNIDEAVAILRDYPPVAGWTYVMTEGDTGRAAVYEVAPGKEHLYELPDDGDRLGYANLYWGEDLVDTEVDYYPQYRRANHARQVRVRNRLRDLKEEAAPPDIADILGDFTDPNTGRRRLFGRTIANVNTVASVVFEPEKRRVWVGSGGSPTSRNWFVPFRLDAVDDHTGGPDVSATPFIVANDWHQSAHGQAFELYRKAAHRFWADESDSRLLILIEHALALYPREPNLHVLAGLLALRIGRARRAEGAFRRALEQITEPERRAEISLFLGWALDLQGQRGAAKYLYKRIAGDEACDARTRSRARQARWIRFTQKQAERLPLDFVYAGVP
ncbi:MAG: C45 family autoproteolytic acyltransferase/hydrolase, partial [Persicimonas sp.]